MERVRPVITRIKILLEFVKFEHTLFALPFAYLGAILAKEGMPSPREWFWITMAMVGARSAGMGLNRIIDRDLDAANPRTQVRPLQTKRITLAQAKALVIGALLLFILSAVMLKPICLLLLPLATTFLFLYSYVKRFSWATHFVLGTVLACAPIGGWVAIRGELNLIPILLGFSVLFWVAGFDIIYTTQDYDVDRRQGIHSLPAQLGISKALSVSRLLHLISFVLVASVGVLEKLGLLFWLGFLGAGMFLIWEHRLIHPEDLSGVNQAFFVMNGWVSVVLFAAVLLDKVWGLR